MNILIVSATALEIAPLVKELGKGRAMESNLTRYRVNDRVIDILVTGVGMVATAYHTGRLLTLRKYDVAVNAGICGSFDRGLKLGDVLNVTSDFFPEKGAESGEYFLSLIDLKVLEQDEFPFSDGKLVNRNRFTSKTLESLPEASAATGNTVHGNEESIQQFVQRFNVQVESMEGAAFLYAAFQQGVKCLQIRSVSNYVETRDTSLWNIPLAIKNLNQALYSVLNE